MGCLSLSKQAIEEAVRPIIERAEGKIFFLDEIKQILRILWKNKNGVIYSDITIKKHLKEEDALNPKYNLKLQKHIYFFRGDDVWNYVQTLIKQGILMNMSGLELNNLNLEEMETLSIYSFLKDFEGQRRRIPYDDQEEIQEEQEEKESAFKEYLLKHQE